MKLTRKIFLALALLAVGLLIAWAYRPEATLVSVTTVSRGPLQVVVAEDGQTRIRERYVMTPPITGYVQRLQLHVGDAVKAGQVLFTLEPLPPAALDARARAETQAQVLRAEAAMRAAETNAQAAAADATFAVREQARLRPLFDTGQISRTQYDRAASDADRAGAALQSARAAIEVAAYERQAAQTALRYAAGERGAAERIKVASPVSGVVLDIQREDEGVVTAGQPVLSVGDPRSLEIVIDVLSADAVRIRPGMAVWLERWGGSEALEARVRTVDPTAFTKVSALGVEEQRVRVVSDLLTPAERWPLLGDAYRVEARFVLWESADALRVPHSSLFRAGEQWAVFAAQDRRAARRLVKLGHHGVLFAEILDGLAEGETIVTYPDDRLADGARVEVREVETP
ncbi:MAG: efflux RND transporter periplasmic adaptor subunit [Metallibacterium scheffleri]|jgi:HlyD family secretion protein|uniref:efflux RND transporter periplasmic adaptor subunit n=1 Tax=Metallibacterium scheffleri TaxID=993689 RepID=UPI0026E9CA5D|nr:efflux RND transporter periplasmic adaptor subunit [Metallibacterium scheffleri]MCK9368317.1 efflux RND transporter periplasmic adaptor subunit [Metallibacterium scheffleri]